MLLLNKGKVVNEHHCNFQFVREKTSVNWFSHVLFFWREKAGNAIIKSCVFSLYRSHATTEIRVYTRSRKKSHATTLLLLWIEP